MTRKSIRTTEANLRTISAVMSQGHRDSGPGARGRNPQKRTRLCKARDPGTRERASPTSRHRPRRIFLKTYTSYYTFSHVLGTKCIYYNNLLADAADLKSAVTKVLWGFESPSRHNLTLSIFLFYGLSSYRAARAQ